MLKMKLWIQIGGNCQKSLLMYSTVPFILVVARRFKNSVLHERNTSDIFTVNDKAQHRGNFMSEAIFPGDEIHQAFVTYFFAKFTYQHWSLFYTPNRKILFRRRVQT